MIGQVHSRRLTASGAGLAVGLVAAALQLAPVIGRGYVLTRDMVFVPRLPLDAHLLGVDAVPRAVPSDLLVALASRVVPGDVVQDLVLVAIITFAGWGAARLASRDRVVVAVAAASLFAWNPYLDERLRQGQWAVLIGYAALPWVASTALALHRGERRAGRRLFLALAAAAVGGASAELLAVVVVLPIALWPGGAVSWLRRAAMVVGSLVVVSLPWAVPALTSPATYPSDKAGVLAFAARSDTPFGTVGSLLNLGGIWNAQVALPGRSLFVVSGLALLVTVASCSALVSVGPWRRGEAGPWWGLVTAGLASFALAVWAAIPGARRLAVDIGSSSTAGGLLRDGQRWLAPFVLVVAVGFGWLVAWAGDRVRLAPALALVPVLLLPAAAWGSDGALVAVHWPRSWSAVTAASRQLPAGPVLVLPWASQRQFSWNDDRVIDDPADRWLPRRVVGDDQLQVSDRATPLEDPLARAVAAAATGTAPLLGALQQQGYAGVLLERDQVGAAAAAARLSGLQPVASAPDLALYAVPPGSAAMPPRASTAPLRVTLAADGFSGLVVLIGIGSVADIRTRPRRTV
jgi:hypothetical protein